VNELVRSIVILGVDWFDGRWVVRDASGRVAGKPPLDAALPEQVPIVPANPHFPFRFAGNYVIGGGNGFR